MRRVVPPSDAQLVSCYLAGDNEAFGTIYKKYAPNLYNAAILMLSDRHDAADMVQDVFCIAIERLTQLGDPEKLQAWLHAILRHEVYQRLHQRYKATPTDFRASDMEIVAHHDPFSEGGTAVAFESEAFMRSAAKGLVKRDLIIFKVFLDQELSRADLAASLGVSMGQSRNLVNRMRYRLQECVDAYIVARNGRTACSELLKILPGWNGIFNVLTRQRVLRHLDSCLICRWTQQKYAHQFQGFSSAFSSHTHGPDWGDVTVIEPEAVHKGAGPTCQ